MAHIERTGHPVMTAYVPPADPAPFTFGAFLDAYYEACRKAWDGALAGGRHEPSVTLPEGLWPDLAKVVNPITRTLTPVQRVPMFTWEKDGTGTTGTPCQPSAEGGMCGCGEDDDGPGDCLQARCDC